MSVWDVSAIPGGFIAFQCVPTLKKQIFHLVKTEADCYLKLDS